MKIVYVGIRNYRNLSGISVSLNEDLSFLVGENDLDKSNLLDMLDIVLNSYRFSDDDFVVPSDPIEIELSLILSDVEIGFFDDFFDPTDNKKINITARQEAPDEIIRYFHKESEEEIHYSKIRCANFIKYDSLRTPRDEMSFHKGRGVGKFLEYLVNKYISEHAEYDAESIVKEDVLEPVIEYINQRLLKLKVFKDFLINASMENQASDLIYDHRYRNGYVADESALASVFPPDLCAEFPALSQVVQKGSCKEDVPVQSFRMKK